MSANNIEHFAFYLVFSLPVNWTSTGKTPRVTKTKPALKSGEVAMRVEVNIPKALFDKPTLAASINIPDNAKISHEISTETINNIEDAILQSTGIDVHLEIKSEHDQE